jgi:probable HAF family extracellular repeat protein
VRFTNPRRGELRTLSRATLEEGSIMAKTAPPIRDRHPRLFLAVAAVMLTVFTAGGSVAAASTPAPTQDGVTRPRTPVPAFLLERGRYTRFDAPRAGLETGATGVNNRAVIVGTYVESNADGTFHGFRRDARGRFTTIDVPGAAATAVSKVNDRGQIVGRYYRTSPIRGPEARSRGFLLDGRRFVRIDVPGARETQAVGINNRGQVVGQYQTADGVYHGFRWERGRFTTVDLPGAGGTSLVDINDRGVILGTAGDPVTTGSADGFVLDRGRFTTFRAPGVPITLARDINNRGQIVGFTIRDVALTGARGFLLDRGVKGRFVAIDVPGAPRSAALGLNDIGAITGYYENTSAAPSSPDNVSPLAKASGLLEDR